MAQAEIRTRTTGQQETNMNLDNASHPGRPRLNELVPSRYALRVGDIDVLVVSDGVFTLPATVMSINADPAARAAWLNENVPAGHVRLGAERGRGA